MTPLPRTATTLPTIDLRSAAGTGAGPERADLLEYRAPQPTSLGFFYVAGHSILAEVEADVPVAAQTFFALPETTRREIPNLNSPHFRGYTALATVSTPPEPPTCASRSTSAPSARLRPG